MDNEVTTIDDVPHAQPRGRPHGRWHQILVFPLVALVIAIATFVLAIFLTTMIMRHVIPPMAADVRSLIGGAIVIGLVFTGYKLVIRHLGEEQRDDLAARHALRDLGLGLGGGIPVVLGNSWDRRASRRL